MSRTSPDLLRPVIDEDPDVIKQAPVRNSCDEYPYKSRFENIDPPKSPAFINKKDVTLPQVSDPDPFKPSVSMNRKDYTIQSETSDPYKSPILRNRQDGRPPQLEKPDSSKRPVLRNRKDDKPFQLENSDPWKLPLLRNRKDRRPQSDIPLSRRHYPTTNFHVPVYKNNEFSRCVYCKSCSMATVKHFIS
jgi:hypothetical protein